MYQHTCKRCWRSFLVEQGRVYCPDCAPMVGKRSDRGCLAVVVVLALAVWGVIGGGL